MHVVPGAVCELADVALLGRDLPGRRLDDDVLDLVEDRDGAVAEVGEHAADLVGSLEDRVVGLHRQGRVVCEVREDRVHVLVVHGLEVARRQGGQALPRQCRGVRCHNPSCFGGWRSRRSYASGRQSAKPR